MKILICTLCIPLMLGLSACQKQDNQGAENTTTPHALDPDK